MDPNRTEFERDVALGRSVHAALLERLHDLLDRDALDASTPSRLPGWNRAQVLAHLSRNADGHRRMIEGAGRGEVLEQYEGGVEGRRVGIAAGSSRSAIDAVRDLAASTAALEAAWNLTDWEGAGRRTLRGETPIDRLAFLRCREVSLHGIDLDIGIELADLDPLYVELELARMERRWAARRPTGSTRLPAAALALTPTDRVGWLTGRLDVHGLEPAGIF